MAVWRHLVACFVLRPSCLIPKTASAYSRSVVTMAALESTAVHSVQCYCGKVALEVTGPPVLGRSFCHCSVCRRLSGAPYSANGLWPSTAVRAVRGLDEPGGVQVLATSKHVTRVRCAACGGPVKADLMGGKAVSARAVGF